MRKNQTQRELQQRPHRRAKVLQSKAVFENHKFTNTPSVCTLLVPRWLLFNYFPSSGLQTIVSEHTLPKCATHAFNSSAVNLGFQLVSQ